MDGYMQLDTVVMQIKLYRRQENLCLSHSLVILCQYCNINTFCLLYAHEKFSRLPVLMHVIGQINIKIQYGGREKPQLSLCPVMLYQSNKLSPHSISLSLCCVPMSHRLCGVIQQEKSVTISQLKTFCLEKGYTLYYSQTFCCGHQNIA